MPLKELVSGIPLGIRNHLNNLIRKEKIGVQKNLGGEWILIPKK